MAGSVEGVLLLSHECIQVAPGVWPTSFVSLGLLKYSIQIREKRLLSIPEFEKQKTGAVFRSLVHTTRLWCAGESPVSVFTIPSPQRTERGRRKARKISYFPFKRRSLLSQMADWDFGTLGVFVQPVREDFVTLGVGGGVEQSSGCLFVT